MAPKVVLNYFCSSNLQLFKSPRLALPKHQKRENVHPNMTLRDKLRSCVGVFLYKF